MISKFLPRTFHLFVTALVLSSFFVNTELSFSQVSSSGSGEKVYLLLSEEGNIAVVDPFAAQLKRRIQVGSRPEYILLERTGKKAYVSNTKTNIVSVVDVVNETTSKIIHIPVERSGITVGSLGYNATKNHLYVAEFPVDNTPSKIWVIDAATDAIIGSFEAGANIAAISVSYDGKKIFVMNETKSIGVYDADSYSSLTTIQPMPINPKDIKAPTFVVNPKKGRAAKQRKSTPALNVSPNAHISRLACHPKKNIMYVTYGSLNQIQIINTDTYAMESLVDVPSLYFGEQLDVYCSPDGRYAFIINHKTDYRTTNSVLILDVAKNQITKLLDAGFVRKGLAVSVDGKMLYTAGKDFKIFDLSTFALVRSVQFQTELAGMVTVGE